MAPAVGLPESASRNPHAEGVPDRDTGEICGIVDPCPSSTGSAGGFGVFRLVVVSGCRALAYKREKKKSLLGARVFVRSVLKRMLDGERDSQEARRRTQSAQLQRLLSHAVREVPYYRERLRDAGFRPGRALTEAMWRRVPVMRRSDVQRHYAELQARRVPREHGPSRESMTTGSTGTPLKVRKTALASLYWDAVTAREMLWHQRDRTLPWHSIRYMKDEAARFPRGLRAGSWGRVAETLGGTGPGYGLHILTDPSDQLDWLARNPPSYLLTYPSNLRDLLDLSSTQGTRFPTLRHVITVGEALPAELRARCRECWDVRICDIYSATEVGYIALQAPTGDHYLVPDEVVRVELLNDDDNPVEVGEPGRVVVTPLHNFAMPLVRYDIGDYAVRGGSSPCGRSLPVIERINGRTRNMLSYPDGRRLWPLFPPFGFRDLAPVRQFRVVQQSLSELTLEVAVERPLTGDEERAVVRALQDSVGYPFQVSVSEHERLARSAGGKYEDFRSLVAR